LVGFSTVVSIGFSAVFDIIKSICELIFDAPKLTAIVGCFTSGNKVVQGLLGLTHELFLVDVLFLHPFLGIWGEVTIDERRGISASFENILLENLERGTINDLIGVS
jgi:hypothetical protein